MTDYLGREEIKLRIFGRSWSTKKERKMFSLKVLVRFGWTSTMSESQEDPAQDWIVIPQQVNCWCRFFLEGSYQTQSSFGQQNISFCADKELR